MSRFSLIGLAVVTAGLMATSTGSSFAMGCLNPFAGVMSLTHNDMVPNEGYGYDKEFVDRQLAKGNRCDVEQQSLSPYQQYNNRPTEDRSRSNGNYN